MYVKHHRKMVPATQEAVPVPDVSLGTDIIGW